MSFHTPTGQSVTITGGKYKGRDGVISRATDCYYYVVLLPHCCGNGVSNEVRVWKSNVKILQKRKERAVVEVPGIKVERNDNNMNDVRTELMAVRDQLDVLVKTLRHFKF